MLSPAFDLNPNPEPRPKDLRTAIDFTDTRASIDTLMSVAEYFRLNAEEATDVLEQVTDAAGRWRAVASSHGLQPTEISAMEPAFEHAERKQARSLTGKSRANICGYRMLDRARPSCGRRTFLHPVLDQIGMIDMSLH